MCCHNEWMAFLVCVLSISLTPTPLFYFFPFTIHIFLTFFFLADWNPLLSCTNRSCACHVDNLQLIYNKSFTAIYLIFRLFGCIHLARMVLFVCLPIYGIIKFYKIHHSNCARATLDCLSHRKFIWKTFYTLLAQDNPTGDVQNMQC